MVGIALSGSTEALLRYAVAFLGAAVALAAIDYINTLTGGRYSILSGRTLRTKAFARVLKLPVAYYESDHSGAARLCA
jgi:ABC-type multidrug transport system fused ATPase/permease subunit